MSAELSNSITPTDSQAAAVRAVIDWYRDPKGSQEFYLAGYAGTGKSTTAALAIEELRDRASVRRVRTGAYTGKAAAVLRKKGVEGAQTIHSMIYTLKRNGADGQPRFVLNPTGPAQDADIIVLDEVSMVADEMAADVRSFGKRILVMGDPGQLPPVRGQGAFTNRKPDVFLTEIHRQAQDSPILRLATLARQGRPIPLGEHGNGVSVRLLDRETQHAAYDPATQPICGVHRVRWTVTQRMRARLGFDGPMPAGGERVLCCRNAHDLGIFNGQQGRMRADAEELEPQGLMVFDVDLEDRDLPLEDLPVHPWLFQQHFIGPTPRPRLRRDVHEFDWGYVLTCHKAQGSEWPHVTVIDDSGAFRDDRDRWLYTAITRASHGLTVLKRAA